MKKVLVTGGTGYIGSHTVVELLNSGKEVVIVDNLSNSKPDVIDRIKKITGKDVKFYNIDYLNKNELERVFEENEIDSVINFAGFKAVGESVKEPLKYYHNNVSGAVVLLETMQKYNVKKFVFSSSATIYGEQDDVKYVETMKRGEASSPYGTTKIMIEKILEDVYRADNSWDIAILRYFNPVGAHESGLIGEDPQGIPNNLMPFIMKVANKEIDHLNIFGNDYSETKDGTCARDFLHVVDLAVGHIKALEKLDFDTAQTAMLQTGDFEGLQFLKKLKNVEDDELKKAEILEFNNNYDEASNKYNKMGRSDLNLAMNIK